MPKIPHYLVELKDCLVQDPDIQAIANDLTDLLTYYQIPIADERKELGVRNHDGSTGSGSLGRFRSLWLLVVRLMKQFGARLGHETPRDCHSCC